VDVFGVRTEIGHELVSSCLHVCSMGDAVGWRLARKNIREEE